MATIKVNADAIVAELGQVADEYKAAILTAAAAIHSRSADDVNHNAAEVREHLEEMGRRLDGLRNGLSQAKGSSEFDRGNFTEAVDLIDSRIDTFWDCLESVLASNHRGGFEQFADRVGPLGRAVFGAIETVTGRVMPAEMLLYFENVFAEAVQKMSELDWSAKEPPA